MPEMPYDPVSQMKFQFRKNRKKNNIQGKDFTVIHIISNLPADASLIMTDSYAFLDNFFLPGEIIIQIDFLLIVFSNIIWRGSDYKFNESIGYLGKKISNITFI